MGLIDKIKSDAKKSGNNKGKFMYFKEGQKTRIRFLNDMEEGMEIVFHDSYAKGVNVPCQEIFGRACPYCDDEEMRTRSQYAWSVWDYDAKEVKIFMFPVNQCSPVPALVALFETYGTLTDRDYIVSVSGKQQNKTFSVIPMDKVKFRNDKAKPLSEKTILKYLDKAYPCEDTEDDIEDEEEDEKSVKKRSAKPKKQAEEDYDDDYDDVEEEENEEPDYSGMSPKELYQLCKKRDIEAEPRKSAKYYIVKLEEYDKAQDDWGDDEEDEDDWEDE